MINDNLPNLDLLDNPEKVGQSVQISYKLVYLELSFLLLFALLNFLGFSVLVLPFFVVILLLYGSIAPFIKPQFTRQKNLRIGLGIWNLIQLLLLGCGIFFTINGAYGSLGIIIISLVSIAIYYGVLPFVESEQIGSLRFLTILLFGFGFSVFTIGILFKLNAWPYNFLLLTAGPVLVGSSGLMMVYQLLKNQKQHYYYWFYVPRIFALIISWFFSM